MTVRSNLITEFEDGELFTLQEAFDLGFKKGSVSSALSRGVKTDDFERVDRGLYKVITVFYEKLLGSMNYCGTQKRFYLARTVEPNEDNREAELAVHLNNIDGCSESRVPNKKQDMAKIRGYQQRITDLREPRYPEVEVIET